MAKTKGKGKKKDGSDLPVEDQLREAEKRIQTMELELGQKSQQLERTRHQEVALKQQLKDAQDEIIRQREQTNDVTAEMTRQYNDMKQEMLTRLGDAEDLITQLKQQMQDAEAQAQQQQQQMNAQIEDKDRTINEQVQRMEEMAVEFGEMLKETLDRMTAEIESASKAWDIDTEIPDKERLEQFGLAHLPV